MNDFLKFKNIKEIKLTRADGNLFSISIKSDIEKNNIDLKDSIFNAKLCRVDPTLELKIEKEYLNIPMNVQLLKSETFSIPINIQLLFNNKTDELFTIETKENH